VTFRYCPACGAQLQSAPPVTCRACGARHWRNAKPCAGGLVMRDGRLLLIRRAIDPWRGCWDIPGGFCDPDEHPADAAVREVREEVGLDVRVTGMLGIWMDTYGSESDGEPAEATLNCYYLAAAGDGSPVVDPREATEAAWFAPDDLPEDVAFPGHTRQVLEVWRDAVGSERPTSTPAARPG
jgi:ADP-ribose pyrophosphatase YjhB (NUDIX family)